MKRRTFLSSVGLAGSAFALSAPAILGQAKPPRIRIGQIGTGHAHAGGKMETMLKFSDLYEVVGCVEPDAKRREAAAKSKSYAGVAWMTEEQLLNTKGLQVVAVETEVCDLLSTADRCIQAGKHIHLDKPAGEDFAQFKRLRMEAARKKLTVQMGYMFRYNPAFQLCYRAFEEGWLGEVFAIETAIGKVIDAGARKKLLPYKGGSIFELGCHVIDSVVKILGRPQKVTAINRSSSALNDGLADNQLAVLEYPKAAATVRSALIEVDGGPRRQFVVCGDRGTFDIRPLEPAHARVAFDRPRANYKKGYQDLDFPKHGRYDGDFLDLAKVVRGEKEFGWSAEHDLAVQETVLLASGLKA